MMPSTANDLPARIAQNYADATFGYMQATTAAYVMMADNAFSFWSDALTGQSKTNKGAGFAVPRPHQDSKLAMPPSAPCAFFGMTPWPASHAAVAPAVQAWWDLFPYQGPPAAWPMAYSMMCAGVPRDIAVPVAEANVALTTAAELTEKSINESLPKTARTPSYSAMSSALSPFDAGAAMASFFMMMPFATVSQFTAQATKAAAALTPSA